MKKIIFVLLLFIMSTPLWAQSKSDSTLKQKSKWKYEIGMAVGTNVVTYPLSYPLVPVFNLDFGASYKRWKFKIEPKVAYSNEKFNYGLTAKVGFVIWKSK